ncbi:UDP-glycosyltransferase 74G1-like [Glycine soja]|uniref:Glycosyltransferase n=1 Tax=Glycine soja TaxID=3848 RepID=A0A0B2PQH5_GLYSO|nr:UDP-glycosyltransferase 74G1-like [Glycine soja]KHN09954.1 UDP-glycosyltransferase 74E1 [Glycine soja]RZB81519.1 UDP-glycosyltransferase 74G1 [Glycine soja]
MEKKSKAKRVHCLVLAYPAQGHTNPMLQFSKLLQHEGVRVTFVSTVFHCKNMKKLPPGISLETISDGFDSGRIGEAKSLRVYLDQFWQVGPKTLVELLEKLNGSSGHPIDCLVYDSFMPWALEVARSFGIVGVVFLTQNMAVNSIYYHVHLGKLQAPLKEEEISLPALPQLQLGDMPSFFFNYVEHPVFLDFLVGQFSNIDKADWILCNSFYELEKEVADWTMKIWPKLRTIGPSIPSMFLDKQTQDDEDYGVAQFTSEECIKWLDDKIKESVIYVSFGSMAILSEEQIEELAYGLRDSESYFLWVVRASEETKLPKNFEKKSEKGLVVSWCSQLKVLAHEAVGCFVTHCGWNSTLEALSLGVPMVAIPQEADQSTNAKHIEDVWKVGIKASVDEKHVVRREVLKRCTREVMDSERGEEMKRNAMQLKTLAANVVGEGGSSHRNITEFVNSLFHL